MKDSVLKSIRARSDRKTDYKPLASRTVIKDPQSAEVQSEMERLDQEIKLISKRIFAEIPAAAKKLRGRIDINEEPGTEHRVQR